MVKPNFLVIGVQKGGTTSLLRHLNRHKDIFFMQKEMSFFSNDNKYKKGTKEYEEQFNKGLNNHIKWMKSNYKINKKPIETINEICKFIGASQIKSKENINYKNNVHKKSYETKISNSDFTKLYLFYKEYNEALYKILGHPIKDWEDFYKKFFDNIIK